MIAARMILKEQERRRTSKKRLGAAKKRAMKVRKKMNIAIRNSDIANLDLAMVVEKIKNEEEQIQSYSINYVKQRRTDSGSFK